MNTPISKGLAGRVAETGPMWGSNGTSNLKSTGQSITEGIDITEITWVFKLDQSVEARQVFEQLCRSINYTQAVEERAVEQQGTGRTSTFAASELQ